MDITKSREEFEAWLESRDCNPVAWLKDAYWEVWKASRESLVVELPEIYGNGVPKCDEYDRAINECADALRTAGIRIKGESE
ncbi:hypothetical protein [Yersinia frederiksenii]|uniref:hypothetical protein n=1 Tax=Yersinia frederiksenii TaxID=29484 RepID=UPI000BFC0616|nr:hypothetical protein [Yersinia frederiksenii]ATM86707.1 hypothetical protein CRN74_11815 [Yersinia frederiksenii]